MQALRNYIHSPLGPTERLKLGESLAFLPPTPMLPLLCGQLHAFAYGEINPSGEAIESQGYLAYPTLLPDRRHRYEKLRHLSVSF